MYKYMDKNMDIDMDKDMDMDMWVVHDHFSMYLHIHINNNMKGKNILIIIKYRDYGLQCAHTNSGTELIRSDKIIELVVRPVN
jgi:hypothetical protein